MRMCKYIVLLTFLLSSKPLVGIEFPSYAFDSKEERKQSKNLDTFEEKDLEQGIPNEEDSSFFSLEAKDLEIVFPEVVNSNSKINDLERNKKISLSSPQENEEDKSLEDPKGLLFKSDLLLTETKKFLQEEGEEVFDPLLEVEPQAPSLLEESTNLNMPSVAEIAEPSIEEKKAKNLLEKERLLKATQEAFSSETQQKKQSSQETAEASKSSLYEPALFVETEFPAFSISEEDGHGGVGKDGEEVITPPFTLIEDKFTEHILTPSLAKRETLKLRLANGLEAYIVSDPESNRSGAALSVASGSWKDPKDLPGLAHFVEHMLFLGTEKYPEESSFKSFIQEHNGQSNAYTTGDHTTYAFSINHDAFEEGLERFTWFFVKPLFNTSVLDREVNAIDQEFARKIEDDFVRTLFVQKEIGNKHHPETRFNSGNSKSLRNVDQRVARDWFEENYSANLMHLVVITPLSIEEVKNLVVKKFSMVRNSLAAEMSPQTTITSPTYDANIVHIAPLKDTKKLFLQWELSTEFAYDKNSKTKSLLAHILGHEGEKSLLAQLKREEFADQLSASAYNVGPNNAFLSLEITLTPYGLEHVNAVIERCFQAIRYMGDNGIPPYIFNEVQSMALIRYRYQSREDVFQDLMGCAGDLIDEDLSTYPEKTHLYSDFNPRLVRKLLSELSPDHCHITLLADPDLSNVKTDRIEKWLGTNYAVSPIPERVLTTWYNATSHENIDVPLPNPFIPEDLKVVNTPEEIQSQPITLIDEEIGRIYFLADRKYFSPEVSWSLRIKTPKMDGTSRNSVCVDLYIKSIEEKLRSVSYQALLAGLDYTIVQSPFSIDISLKGYSEKAGVFFQKILNTLKVAKPSQSEFSQYKQVLQSKYSNFSKESPLEQSSEIMYSVLFKDFSSMEEKAELIQEISLEDFSNFWDTLFEETFFQGMFYGNMDASQAREVWKEVLSNFSGKSFPLAKQKRLSLLVLPQSVGPFYLVDRVDRQGNAVLLMLQNGFFTFKNRAAQQILSKGLQEPFYSTLRTKQQTGYVVWNWSKEVERQLYSFFAVQSNSHNVRDLLARFELFLETFLQEFSSSTFPKERFEIIKKALMTELKQPRKSLQEMGGLLQTLAFEYDGDFDWIDKRIQGFEELDYEEFSQLSNSYIGRSNKQRLAILMKGDLPQDKAFYYYRVDTAEKMREISDYTSRDVR